MLKILLLLLFSRFLFASEVVSMLKNMGSFKADFSQQNLTASGNSFASGQIFFQAPNHLKVKQQKPFAQIIYINDDISIVYDIELAQAVIRKAAFAKTPLFWLFDIDLTAEAKYIHSDNKEQRWYSLIRQGSTIEFAFKAKQLNTLNINHPDWIFKLNLTNIKSLQQALTPPQLTSDVDILDYRNN